MTGAVVNLNKARKAKVRADGKQQADANALRHGQTAAEKARLRAEKAKAKRDLDGHARE